LLAGGVLLLLARRIRIRFAMLGLLYAWWPLAAQVSDFEIIESSCGAPGNNSCPKLTCSPPGTNQIRRDPHTPQIYCSLGDYQRTANRPIIPSPFDITFLIGTDLHHHNGWSITDAEHFLHAKATNSLPSLGLKRISCCAPATYAMRAFTCAAPYRFANPCSSRPMTHARTSIRRAHTSS
jgi:hypothetical protein